MALNHKERTFTSRPMRLQNQVDRTRIEGLPLDVVRDRMRQTPPCEISVEIGCGVGLHPIRYAIENPKKTIVAIERTKEKFERFWGRLNNHPQLHSQLCAVHADAIDFLDRFFDPATLDEVWILYPNPEPKKASKRWFHAPFLNHLTTLMKPQATLNFATNLEGYADECRERAATYGFHIDREQRIHQTTHPDWRARTHFEKKYFLRGETLFDFKLIRSSNLTGDLS